MSLRDDPIFGPMYYMGDRLRYWECKVVFAPMSSVIEVFVDGSADDGNQSMLLWAHAGGRYSDLIEFAKETDPKELTNEMKDAVF
jgi:hypothetical protein